MFYGPQQSTINLALQGGGAHGAFTWGVLDALLEDGRLNIEGISGTSAGALNAVCVAEGIRKSGREGARQQLRDFWQAVAVTAPLGQLQVVSEEEPPKLLPVLKVWLQFAEYFSPSQFNPMNINPLRDILVSQIDFEGLRSASPMKLFISATHARTGKLLVKRENQLSLEGVLASACLPHMHHTIHLDGEPYWDGGYSANPAIFPLCFDCEAHDIVLVLLRPRIYETDIHSAESIKTRIQDMAFSTAFLTEMRILADLQSRFSSSCCHLHGFERQLTQARFHLINDDSRFANLPAETKVTPHLRFFELLFDAGRHQAKDWLSKKIAHLGHRSSLDIADYFS
jgi:NTE family protein